MPSNNPDPNKKSDTKDDTPVQEQESEPEGTQATFDTLTARRAFSLDNIEVIERGQITIRDDPRETHGIEIGDHVDIEVYHSGETIKIPDARIGESGRVTIPARQRRLYDVNVGDRVDVGVFLD